MNNLYKKHTKPTKFIFVTGAGHSGTRLVMSILGQHPAISIPFNHLNSVHEFIPLHKFFVKCLTKTSFNSKKYFLDKTNLNLILEKYKNLCNIEKIVTIKMPYYPLNYLNEIRAILGDVIFLGVKRNTDKIINSYKRRNQHIKFFELEKTHHIKKLNYTIRKSFYNKTPIEILRVHINEINMAMKKNDLLIFDMEKLISNGSIYINSIFNSLSLPIVIKDLSKIINKGRLIK